VTLLVLVEHIDGVPTGASLETLSLVRDVASAEGRALEVAALGPGAADVAARLGPWWVSTVWVADASELEPYAPAGWGRALAGLIRSAGARLVAGPGTGRSLEMLAAAAAHLDAPLAAGCIAIAAAPAGAPDGGAAYAVTRLRWGGSVLEDAILTGDPVLISVPEHVIPLPDPLPDGVPVPALRRVALPDLGVTPDELRCRLVHHEPARPGSIALADARVVVGGGRGVGGAEAFAQLEELASLLGGAIGVSRVVTSAGWRPHAEQVGQTGTRIAPDLYIACGISGAIQHLVGCRSAKAILAINTDPDAPIMSRATQAVIGDLHAVVPAIIAELRRAPGN